MLFKLGKYRYNLSTEQIHQLNKTFNTFSNSQLFVKPTQIIIILKSEGIYLDQKQLEQTSYKIFKEHNKVFFNVYEFVAIVARSSLETQTINEIKKVFDILDIRKKGKLTCSDLKKSLQVIGQNNVKDKDIDRMFLQLDLDSDGAIDFEEFLAAIIAQ